MEGIKTIIGWGLVILVLYILFRPIFDTSNQPSSRYCDVECQAQRDYADYRQGQETMRYR